MIKDNLTREELIELALPKNESELNIQLKEFDKEWLETLKDKWWSTNYEENNIIPKEYDKVISIKSIKLRDILLNKIGHQACLPLHDEDIDKLLKYGRFYNPLDYKYICIKNKSNIGRCHEISISLWNDFRKSTIFMTGYVLDDDGMWREHSWCIEIKKNKNCLIETTPIKRLLYFGIPFIKEECEEFLSWY